MKTITASSWPAFTEEEADAVASIIRSNRVNYWTGHEGRKFETEFAEWCGSRRAVALANGTLALDLALKALGIGPGDEVIVTPRTFIASVSCVVNAGATPVFADVDYESGNINPVSIAAALSPSTRAIIPVHLAGWPCDMHGIMSLAVANGLAVIEDCAQAHGAMVGDRSVGSLGHVGAWSFCQDKIMTTGGEGGMVTTDDEDLWSRMWSFKDHGKSWDAVYNQPHGEGFRWVHESFGTNWRMLEVQAIIGRIQLRRMAAWNRRRAAIATAFTDALAPHSGAARVPLPADELRHAFYRHYCYVRPDGLKPGWSRDRIVRELSGKRVAVLHGTCPEVYLEAAFDNTALRPKQRLPIARELGETSMMFLTHPTMTESEVARSCAAIEETMTAASR